MFNGKKHSEESTEMSSIKSLIQGAGEKIRYFLINFPKKTFYLLPGNVEE